MKVEAWRLQVAVALPHRVRQDFRTHQKFERGADSRFLHASAGTHSIIRNNGSRRAKEVSIVPSSSGYAQQDHV
jgi:hypothetical protein